MNKIHAYLSAFLLLMLTSASSFAQNYYVCDTGNDSNDGKSESTPFKSYDKAMDTFGTMSGGDNIFFCRGGVFPKTERKRLANFNCSAAEVCTIADYGESSKDRPKIIVTGEHGFDFQDGGDADHDGGYLLKNLILMSTNKTSSGIFLFNDVDDITFDNLHIEGFVTGIYSAATNTPSSNGNRLNERLILKNSVLINNAAAGWLGGGNDLLIENNHFEANGKGLRDHNIYLASQTHHTTNTNITIRGNTLYKSSMENGKCSGVSLVAHGLLDNLLIENNIIKEDVGKVNQFCWGISVDPGYFEQEVFNNVIIRNNQLINMGNIGIGCASCVGVVVENNTIIDESNTLTSAIKIPVREEDASKSKDVKISGNKIILSHENGIGINVAGENVYSIINNSISQPTDAIFPCIKKEAANINTDTASNTCSNHTSISFIDTTDQDAAAQQAAADAAAQQAAADAAAQQAAADAAAQQAAADAAAQQAAADAAAQQAAADAAAQQAAADAAAQQAAADATAQQAAADAAAQQAAADAAAQQAAADAAAQQAAADAAAANTAAAYAAAQQAAADAAAQQAAADVAAQQAAADVAAQEAAADAAAANTAAAYAAAQQAAADAAAQQAAADAAAANTVAADATAQQVEQTQTISRKATLGGEARSKFNQQKRSSLGSTSLADVNSAGGLDYSSVDSRECRASTANGRCLMF